MIKNLIPAYIGLASSRRSRGTLYRKKVGPFWDSFRPTKSENEYFAGLTTHFLPPITWKRSFPATNVTNVLCDSAKVLVRVAPACSLCPDLFPERTPPLYGIRSTLVTRSLLGGDNLDLASRETSYRGSLSFLFHTLPTDEIAKRAYQKLHFSGRLTRNDNAPKNSSGVDCIKVLSILSSTGCSKSFTRERSTLSRLWRNLQIEAEAWRICSVEIFSSSTLSSPSSRSISWLPGRELFLISSPVFDLTSRVPWPHVKWKCTT